MAQCSTETWLHAGTLQQHTDNVWTAGYGHKEQAGAGEGQPAAPTRGALVVLLSSRLVVPAKDCWEIFFLVYVDLEKADMLYYSFLSGSSTYVGVRENTQGPINQ